MTSGAGVLSGDEHILSNSRCWMVAQSLYAYAVRWRLNVYHMSEWDSYDILGHLDRGLGEHGSCHLVSCLVNFPPG